MGLGRTAAASILRGPGTGVTVGVAEGLRVSAAEAVAEERGVAVELSL